MSPVSLSMVPFDSIFSGESFLRVPGPENSHGTPVLILQNFAPEGHILPSEIISSTRGTCPSIRSAAAAEPCMGAMNCLVTMLRKCGYIDK